MPNELLQYQEQRADIQEKMEALHKTADDDQDGILTEEQQVEWDALKAQREEVKATEARASELREERRNAPAARSSAPVVTEIHNRVEYDPRRGFTSHQEFISCVMAAMSARNREDVPDERLRALAAGNGGDTVPELAFMLPRAWTPPGLLATAGSDEQGGYDYGRGGAAVPVTLLPGMLQLGFEGDPTVGRTLGVPMTSPIVSILARVDKDHSTSVSGGFTIHGDRRPWTSRPAGWNSSGSSSRPLASSDWPSPPKSC